MASVNYDFFGECGEFGEFGECGEFGEFCDIDWSMIKFYGFSIFIGRSEILVCVATFIWIYIEINGDRRAAHT